MKLRGAGVVAPGHPESHRASGAPGGGAAPEVPPNPPQNLPPVGARRWQEAAPPQTPLGHRRVHLAEPGLP